VRQLASSCGRLSGLYQPRSVEVSNQRTRTICNWRLLMVIGYHRGGMTTRRQRQQRPQHPKANQMKAKALARKRGYKQAYSHSVKQMQRWGVPEELIPNVQGFLQTKELIIPPNDEVAGQKFLERIISHNVALAGWAGIRGLIGYPTEAPPTVCLKCEGTGIEADADLSDRKPDKRDNCAACAGDGKVREIYLKPDPKIMQIMDERTYGKPKQAVEVGIDGATRDMIERVLGGPMIEGEVIEARDVELIESGDDDDGV
jgi:hypothetical protein